MLGCDGDWSLATALADCSSEGEEKRARQVMKAGAPERERERGGGLDRGDREGERSSRGEMKEHMGYRGGPVAWLGGRAGQEEGTRARGIGFEEARIG